MGCATDNIHTHSHHLKHTRLLDTGSKSSQENFRERETGPLQQRLTLLPYRVRVTKPPEEEQRFGESRVQKLSGTRWLNVLAVGGDTKGSG